MNLDDHEAVVRRCLAALPDAQVRNLMEHAANRTRVLLNLSDLAFTWTKPGAG